MAEITREELVTLLDSAGERPQLLGWDLSGLDMQDLDLRDANLEEVDLQGADLRDSDLRGADLTGVDLTDADLRGADLRGAKVTADQLVTARSLQRALLPGSMEKLDGLPPQFATRLRKAGLQYRCAVEQAVSEGDEALTSFYGIGPATLAAVKEWLQS